jgi:hypothetical protein
MLRSDVLLVIPTRHRNDLLPWAAIKCLSVLYQMQPDIDLMPKRYNKKTAVHKKARKQLLTGPGIVC